MKSCRLCGKEKHLDEFQKRKKGSLDGHYNTCRECRNAHQRKYQKTQRANPAYRERGLQRKRELRADPVFREKERAKGREYARKRRQDPHYRAYIRDYCREWHKRNPGKSKEYSAKRYRRAGTHSTALERAEIYERDGGKCHLCKRRVSKNRFELDHLVPVSAGGKNERSNLALAHVSCNRKRHVRGPAQLRLTDV